MAVVTKAYGATNRAKPSEAERQLIFSRVYYSYAHTEYNPGEN